MNSIAWNSIWILSTGWFLDKQPSWATEEKQTVPASIANQVETYKDLVQGYKILRPIGWNEFAGQRNQYDIKWQDIIQPLEMVMIATVDIGKNKSVKELGSPTVRLKLLHIEKKHYPWKKQLGEKLAKNRKMQLVAAVEKESGGVPAYEIELKAEPLHELVLVTAVKNKLFSVTASCSEVSWILSMFFNWLMVYIESLVQTRKTFKNCGRLFCSKFIKIRDDVGVFLYCGSRRKEDSEMAPISCCIFLFPFWRPCGTFCGKHTTHMLGLCVLFYGQVLSNWYHVS